MNFEHAECVFGPTQCSILTLTAPATARNSIQVDCWEIICFRSASASSLEVALWLETCRLQLKPKYLFRVAWGWFPAWFAGKVRG